MNPKVISALIDAAGITLELMEQPSYSVMFHRGLCSGPFRDQALLNSTFFSGFLVLPFVSG